MTPDLIKKVEGPRERKPTDLGDLLALARELKGWSQRELAKRSNVGHVVIAQIETGHIKDPSFSSIVRLADALGLKLERFAAALCALEAREQGDG